MTHRDPDLTHPDDDPTALFWCWTENEPSTFRCRELHHDVRAFTPGTPVGISERASRQSTSALLRQTQEALAASQADLTAAKTAVAECNKRVRDFGMERDLARAELASARQEIESLRSQVAHLTVERAALGQMLDVATTQETEPDA